MLRRIRTLATLVGDNVDAARADVEAMPAGGHALLPMIQEAVSQRCRDILAGLEDREGADD